MAQKKKPATHTIEKRSNANEIWGVVVIVLGILVGVTVYGKSEGVVLQFIGDFICGIAGIISWAVPVMIAAGGVLIIAGRGKKHVGRTVMIWVAVWSVLCIAHLFTVNALAYDTTYGRFIESAYELGKTTVTGGGAVSALLLFPIVKLLGTVGAYVFFFALIIIAILVITKLSLKKLGSDVGRAGKKAAMATKEQVELMRERRHEAQLARTDNSQMHIETLTDEPEPEVNPFASRLEEELSVRPRKPRVMHDIERDAEPPWEEPAPEPKKIRPVRPPSPPTPEPVVPVTAAPEPVAPEPVAPVSAAASGYQRPPLSCLNKPTSVKQRTDSGALRDNAKLLEDTLSSFGVSAEVTNISCGPVITRYELVPDIGVKISSILNLSNDIALKMASPQVRIEAPIPGKSAVGIEVPNAKAMSVCIYDMIDSPEYKKLSKRSPLTFALGQDIAGNNIYGDINAMPHLLVAGATGSGKSVCLNTMIISVLMNATPDEVKFIMIDPKMVELTKYNGIPHLKWPVVTDAKKALGTLNWAVAEMTGRYKLFSERGASDIAGYNSLLAGDEEKLPYVVIVVDELADLMLTSRHEAEDTIMRIAQLGRAAGIHLVIATQRPSVNVITGIIKANVPSRVALAVVSQVDSRTILDAAGAEKLIGRGDMLYQPAGAPKPVRAQGAFVSDGEIHKVVAFLRENNAANAAENERQAEFELPERDEDETADPLLPRAIEIGLEAGQISTSMLQRRLRVGYARAGNIIDDMEQRGLVSAYNGSKPREMLISREEYEAMGGGDEQC